MKFCVYNFSCCFSIVIIILLLNYMLVCVGEINFIIASHYNNDFMRLLLYFFDTKSLFRIDLMNCIRCSGMMVKVNDCIVI